jgi:arginase
MFGAPVVSRQSCDAMKRILVPYHHAEPLPALAEVFAADDAVVVSKGPPGMMLARLYQQVAQRVAAADGPVVVASGDCTTALGTVAGLQARGLEPGAIWLDAHGDFHTPRTTRSGYFGGMALAMLTGRAGTTLASAAGLRPLSDETCALVGARDLDPAEIEALAASRVRQITLAELAEAELPPPPWYVHLDVDVLDPDGLPPLRFPAPGGPAPEALATALRALAARGTIAALGLACTFTAKALAAPDPLKRIRPLVDAALGLP